MCNKTAVVGGTAVLPDRLLENATLVFSSRIESIAEADMSASGAQVIDATGCWVLPGLIDMHVHGGAGSDFMDGSPDAIRRASRAHLRHGTTTLFPTTTTGSADQIMAMIEACRQLDGDEECPHLAGVHLYGPYFAEDKVGCHSVAGRRSPQATEYDAYFNSRLVRIATCAAELPGAHEFYSAAQRAECLITCGHSNASWSEMQAAFDQGMRHVDHFWCAMSSIASLRQRFGVPMQASMAEFVIMNQEMSTEVIADGWHLAPELLEFAYRMLGPKRLCLVTDCNRAMDMPPGEYRFGNLDDGSWFRSDGQVGWAMDGKSLASSVMGLDHMLRHMRRTTSASLPEVVRMASLTPAERTGISRDAGSLEVGKWADLVIMDDQLRVQQVYLRGRQVACLSD